MSIPGVLREGEIISLCDTNDDVDDGTRFRTAGKGKRKEIGKAKEGLNIPNTKRNSAVAQH